MYDNTNPVLVHRKHGKRDYTDLTRNKIINKNL